MPQKSQQPEHDKSMSFRLTSIVICAIASVFCGCREEKSIGSDDIFPQNATKLYFGDCNPFVPDQESTDLVFDAADACTVPIEFYSYRVGTWYSNMFEVPNGTYYEGYHLVFNRDMADAGQITVLHITFKGLAVQFTDRVEIPVGQTRVIADQFVEGTAAVSTDSLAKISIQITDSGGYARLVPNYGNGAYIMTGADQNAICRFAINLGLAHGLGYPNQGVTFSFENASGEIIPSLSWDFTSGAVLLDGPVLKFGPRYGVVYLTAQSGNCQDTASFWAPPGTRYRDDELARFTEHEGYYRDYVSDGNTVWYWEVASETNDTIIDYHVRVRYLTQWLLFEHTVSTEHYSTFSVLFDDANNLIWVIQNSSSSTDSAWGYTTNGLPDTAVSCPGITVEAVYRGQWLSLVSKDVFFRRAELTPLGGRTANPIGPFPIELTQQFAGGAGIGYPGVALFEYWTVNVFDSLGNWTARQPVPVVDDEYIYGAAILASGRRIVYQVYSNYALYVRVLQPA